MMTFPVYGQIKPVPNHQPDKSINTGSDTSMSTHKYVISSDNLLHSDITYYQTYFKSTSMIYGLC